MSIIKSRMVEAEEVDITPMIDIVFQLIIFFMVVMAISAVYGVAIKFPPRGSSKKADNTKKEKQLTVYVQQDLIEKDHKIVRDGFLKFNGEEIPLGYSSDSTKRAMEREKGYEYLEYQMKEFMQQEDVKKEMLIVQGDMKTYHGKIMKVVDVAKDIHKPGTDSSMVKSFSLVPPVK